MRFGHSQYSKTAHTRMNTQVVLTPKIIWREVSRFERAIASIEQIVPSEEVQNCIDRGRQGSSDGNQGSLVVFPGLFLISTESGSLFRQTIFPTISVSVGTKPHLGGVEFQAKR